uniref:C2H2-type domain-containing protein n=1 Tax=Anopheles culicifacies TaxID=139723 RepID=A0A182MCI4_9DIPT
MRTHIRMHFDKKTSEFNEENFITCILEEDGIEIPPAGAQNAAAMAAVAAAHAIANQKFTAVQEPQDHTGVPRISPPVGAPAGNGQVVRHHCELCPYSSSYRVNVAKHIKHVHGRERPSTGNSPLIGGGGESLLYNGTIGGETGPTLVRPPVSNTPGLTAAHSQVIKTEPKDDVPNSGSGPQEDTDTPDINVDIVMEEPAIKSELFDPHMPSLNSPLGSPPSPPVTANVSLKTKSHSTAVSTTNSPPLEHGIKTPSPPVAEVSGGSPASQHPSVLPPGPKYCDTCDITFNYTNTYIAHKKFYCKAAIAAAATASAAANVTTNTTTGPIVGRRSASASPSRAATGGATSPAVAVAVNRATETSV